jgi:mRNA-degrading endonuclease RelE of RelBE toxin-antitoxin system
MDTFELLIHPAAAKDLEKLAGRNSRLLARAGKAPRGLQSNPYGGQKESGPISDCYALGFTFEEERR